MNPNDKVISARKLHEDVDRAIFGLSKTIAEFHSLIDEQMPVNDWILCDERLPNKHEQVEVVTYGSDILIPDEGESIEECQKRLYREMKTVTIAVLGSDGWYGADGFPMVIRPTWWRPIPEAPDPPVSEQED